MRKNTLLLLFICIEIITLFYTSRFLPQTINATAHFFSSLLFGIILIKGFYNKKVIQVAIADNTVVRKNTVFIILTVLPFAVACLLLNDIFKKCPIDPAYSDVIPSIQMMVQRCFSGTFVYAPYHGFGYLLYPTYLPMQWLPYIIAETVHFDYRWVAQAIWFISFLWLAKRLIKVNNTYMKLLVPVISYFFYFTVLDRERPFFAHTVEIMVAGYYILFIISLNQKNLLATAFIFMLCLLSRYSLVLWLPLWAYVMWVSKQRKMLFAVTGLCVLMVACIYVLPFLSKDWDAFARGIQHYSGAALGEWQHLDYRGLPYSVYNGVGFAHLFYQMENIPVFEKIKMLQALHLGLCLTAVLALCIWYTFNRSKINTRIFLMASFKTYLAFFLAFIQVPYIYLMVVGVFVSVAIFAEQLAYTTEEAA